MRIRGLAVIAAILTIAAGLTVRKGLPWGFWSKYSGIALWSVVVYALVVVVRPRTSVTRTAAIALLISWVVEFAQITPVSGWLSSQHPGFRLVFGEHFSFKDLPAYAAGVVVASIMHALAVCSSSTRLLE
jgi:hypothetical protein